MGAVLSQVWDDGDHPVAYESRKMNAAKVNLRGVTCSHSCITYLEALFIGESFYCCHGSQFVEISSNSQHSQDVKPDGLNS